jgi:hypothetical protein
LLEPPARIGRLPPAAARPTAHGPRGTIEPRDETTAKRVRISVHSKRRHHPARGSENAAFRPGERERDPLVCHARSGPGRRRRM